MLNVKNLKLGIDLDERYLTDIKNLKTNMEIALSSAFYGKNSPEEVDQIAINTALSSIYEFLKI